MIIIRKIIWRLFKVPSVALIDFDGDITVAFAHQDVLGGWFAYRHRSISKIVHLQPFGSCSGVCYVHGWQPLIGAFGSDLMRKTVVFHEQEAA
jgi:hypothetical protein